MAPRQIQCELASPSSRQGVGSTGPQIGDASRRLQVAQARPQLPCTVRSEPALGAGLLLAERPKPRVPEADFHEHRIVIWIYLSGKSIPVARSHSPKPSGSAIPRLGATRQWSSWTAASPDRELPRHVVGAPAATPDFDQSLVAPRTHEPQHPGTRVSGDAPDLVVGEPPALRDERIQPQAHRAAPRTKRARSVLRSSYMLIGSTVSFVTPRGA